jgi:hypothetical protein
MVVLMGQSDSSGKGVGRASGPEVNILADMAKYTKMPQDPSNTVPEDENEMS